MGHFYDLKGNPAYTIIGKNGKERDTNIRDARQLNLVPSVTTITSVAARPGLEIWKTQQVLLAAIKHKDMRISDKLTDDQWKGLVLAESKKIAEQTSKRGNELHNHLEHALLTQEVFESEYTEPVLELLEKTFDLKIIEPEKSFAHPLKFGGRVDLVGHTKVGDYIIDFKSKNKEVVNKTCVTDDHLMQLAAYRLGLDIPRARCYNLYLSAIKPGQVYLHEWSEEELVRGEKMFLTLLEFWKLSNKL